MSLLRRIKQNAPETEHRFAERMLSSFERLKRINIKVDYINPLLDPFSKHPCPKNRASHNQPLMTLLRARGDRVGQQGIKTQRSFLLLQVCSQCPSGPSHSSYGNLFVCGISLTSGQHINELLYRAADTLNRQFIMEAINQVYLTRMQNEIRVQSSVVPS